MVLLSVILFIVVSMLVLVKSVYVIGSLGRQLPLSGQLCMSLGHCDTIWAIVTSLPISDQLCMSLGHCDVIPLSGQLCIFLGHFDVIALSGQLCMLLSHCDVTSTLRPIVYVIESL